MWLHKLFNHISIRTAELVSSLAKTPIVLIVAIAVIAFTVTFAGLYVFVIQPFQIPDQTAPTSTQTPSPATNPPLTPARDLVGTWKTSFATKFYIKTDFQTGTLQDVGSEDRTMTWIVTSTSDENVVNIEVDFTSSNQQLSSDAGYTPDVSPMFLTGTISGSRLTLQSSSDGTVGQFSFTTDIITGTWNDQWTMAYSQEVYTATNGLTLTRQ